MSPRRLVAVAVLALATLAAIAALVVRSRQDPVAAGQASMKQGQYRAAVIDFKNAVEDTPQSIPARLELADALERVNEPAGVDHHLRSALANGGDADALVPRIAFLMLERNDVDKLVQEFQARKLASATADADLRAIVAMAFVARGQAASAHEQLVGVASTPTVSLARAQLLLSEGKRADALALLDGFGAASPAPWWILRADSRLAASYGKTDAALSAIRRAHQAVPWNNAVTGEYGEALMNAGQFEQAAAVRDELRKTAPNYFWTAFLDASLKMRAGDADGALAAGSKVLSAVPEHLPATLIVASAEMQHGDVEMPLKRLVTITAKYPTSVPALTLLAQAQARAGELQDASETVRRGLLLAPDHLGLLSQQADIDLQAGQREQAAAVLATIVQRDPKNADAALRLAEVKGSLGEQAAAATLLDRVAGAAQGDATLLDRVVASALRMKDVPRAARVAAQGVAAMPQDPQARLTLAAAQAASKDVAAARASTLAALDLKPTYPPALAALGAMAGDPAQRDEVLARYAKAVDASTTDVPTYLAYAARLRAVDRGAKDDARTPTAVLEKGMAMAPDAVRLRIALVEQYLRDGAVDKALSAAQSGVAAANPSPRAQELMASTYERLGKPEQASESYRKLMAAFPQRADWSLKVAQFEIDAGHPTQAVSVLRALISNRPFDPAGYARLAILEAPTQTEDALSIVHDMATHPTLEKDALVLEGDVLVLAGREEEALKQYDVAAKAGATPVAPLRAAGLLERLDRSAAAESVVAGLLHDRPKDPAVLGFAAQRALASGNAAAGVDLLKRVVALDPSNAIALNDLAWAQAAAHRPEAVATARQALALMPGQPKVLDTLGVALLEAGQKTEAVTTLRLATNLAPTADGPKLHLARALVATGDRKAAGDVARSIAAQKLVARDRAALDDIVASTKI